MLNAEKRDVRLIAHFFLFKRVFSNGIIYKFKNCGPEHQKMLGLSRNTIKKIIDRFINKGWAERRGPLVFLKGKRELADRYAVKISDKRAYVSLNPEENIVDQLRLALLTTKIDQSIYAKAGAEARDTRLKKKIIQHKIQKLRESFMPLSGRRMAVVFGGSKSNAGNIVKKLASQGKVNIQKAQIKFVTHCDEFVWSQRDSWWFSALDVRECFLYKGCVFWIGSNRYQLVRPKDYRKELSSLLKQTRNLTYMNIS
jgi:hypothetical protein